MKVAIIVMFILFLLLIVIVTVGASIIEEKERKRTIPTAPLLLYYNRESQSCEVVGTAELENWENTTWLEEYIERQEQKSKEENIERRERQRKAAQECLDRKRNKESDKK